MDPPRDAGGSGPRPASPSRPPSTTSPPQLEQEDPFTGLGSVLYLISSRSFNFVAQVIILVILTAMLIGALVTFRGTWGRECDYWEKVWSTVWLVRGVAQHGIAAIWSYLHWRRRGRPWLRPMRCLQILFGIFKLIWWLYGIKPVLVDPHCNSQSHAWGLTLWILDTVLNVGPYVCICLLIPVCLLCVSTGTITFGEQPTGHRSGPTPPAIRAKLKVVKYESVKEFLESEMAKSVGGGHNQRQQSGVAASNEEGGGDAGLARHLPSLASAIMGVPLPELNQLRRAQSSGTLGRNASLIGAPAGGNTDKVSCPVCYCEFENDDGIVQLPCDPRHAFHEDCLFSWLDQAKVCPVCRADIEEGVNEKERAAKARDPTDMV